MFRERKSGFFPGSTNALTVSFWIESSASAGLPRRPGVHHSVLDERHPLCIELVAHCLRAIFHSDGSVPYRNAGALVLRGELSAKSRQVLVLRVTLQHVEQLTVSVKLSTTPVV